MAEHDMIRMDLVMGSMRLAIQNSVAELFADRQAEVSQMIDETIAAFDWKAQAKQFADQELKRQVEQLVKRSMHRISNDMSGYEALKNETEEFVKVRMAKLWLDDQAKEREKFAEKERLRAHYAKLDAESD